MIELDVGVYSHRHSHWQVTAAESIARYTRCSYRLIQICEPGTAHVNLNRVLEASSARYLAIIDEDASFTQDHWWISFKDTIADPDIGLVGAYARRTTFQEPPDTKTHTIPWTPGYFMGVDREKIQGLRFDEAIPGLNGMTDVDFCRQIAEKGLKIVRDNRIVMHHPQRDEDDVRLIEQRPTTKQQALWFHDQINYMRAKWGEQFDHYVRAGIEAATPQVS